MADSKQIALRVSPDSTPVFANIAQVSVSDEAVVLQFAYIRPHEPEGQLLSEVVLSPKHAIAFGRSLDATIKKHFTRHLTDK
ncbi:MAG TPA: DUF3467 domain-containing protein [Candidatus Paceibacterota bacterium]|nr:DUF3467 domain-containing protein [Candidatus Paceibacterota bacterium]